MRLRFFCFLWRLSRRPWPLEPGERHLWWPFLWSSLALVVISPATMTTLFLVAASHAIQKHNGTLPAVELDHDYVGNVIVRGLAALGVIGHYRKRKRLRNDDRVRKLHQGPLLKPDFTIGSAICRQMYATDPSTLVESLPEKAPQPCAPQPTYPSTMSFSQMICRPVKSATPWS